MTAHWPKLCTLLAAGWLTAGAVTAAGAETEARYQLLFMGNSHSARYDLPGLVARLIEAGQPGASARAALAPRSAFLAERIDDAVTQETLESERWTHVVLQAQKYSTSGKYRYPTDAAEEWIRRVRAAGAEPLLYPEWARRHHEDETFRIHRLHTAIATREPACIAPVGLAWETVRRRQPGLRLHAPDGNHANRAGTLLTAMVLYQSISSRPADQLPELDDVRVDPEEQLILRSAAAEAHRVTPNCPPFETGESR